MKNRFTSSAPLPSPRYSVFGLGKSRRSHCGPQKHGRALYEKNIRYFIGAGRRGVNRHSRYAAEYTTNFMYLNNGITLVGFTRRGQVPSQRLKA